MINKLEKVCRSVKIKLKEYEQEIKVIEISSSNLESLGLDNFLDRPIDVIDILGCNVLSKMITISGRDCYAKALKEINVMAPGVILSKAWKFTTLTKITGTKKPKGWKEGQPYPVRIHIKYDWTKLYNEFDETLKFFGYSIFDAKELEHSSSIGTEFVYWTNGSEGRYTHCRYCKEWTRMMKNTLQNTVEILGCHPTDLIVPYKKTQIINNIGGK